jgi:hypothetical protein
MARWVKYSFGLVIVLACGCFSVYWFSRGAIVSIHSSATRDLRVSAVHANGTLVGADFHGDLKSGPLSLRKPGMVSRMSGRYPKIGDEYKVKTNELGEFVCHLSSVKGSNCSVVRLWVSDDKLTCYCDGYSAEY